MGRSQRVIDPNVIYHAGSRGSNRFPIAFDPVDFESLVDEIDKAASRHEWRVLAWCVLPNHTHFVMSATTDAFSNGFREINGNHSRRTNRRHGRDAHLFKNRPWSIELATPAHLIGGIAYVLRNPIADGLVERAEDWPYSSYRASMGLEPAPGWLAVHDLLSLFGHTPREARRNLEALVHRGQLPADPPVSDTD